MANKNFEIKNGLTVAGTERITSAGLVTGTTTTQAASDNTTKLASTAYVTTALAALADSAPSTLNTLNELAAALGDDANYSTTTTNAIAAKLPLAGGTLTGALTTNGVINTTTSANFAINTPNSVRINIDSNNDQAGESFIVGNNQTTVNQNNVLFKVQENGNVGIGTSAPSGLLSIPATDTTTKPQIRFMTTGASNLADAALSTTDDSGGTNLLIGSNQYYSGASIARFDTSRSGTAIDFGYTGRIKFFTGSGNAAPTERMQIDSSGHLLVATTAKKNGYPARFTTTSLSTPASEEACHILELVGNRTTNAGNQNGMIQFWNNTSTAAEVGRISSIQGTAVNSGAFTFATYNAGSSIEAMRIVQDGSIGIGELNPDRTFHVKSGTTNVVAKFESTDAIAAIEFTDSGGSAEMGCDGSDVVLFPAGAEKFRVNTSGNIVAQSASQNRIVLGSTGNPSNNTSNWVRGNQGYLQFNSASSGYNWEIGGANKMSINSGGDLTTQAITAVANGNYASGTVPLIAKSVSNRGTVRVRSDGDNPAELFFDVNGGIRWDFSSRDSSSNYDLLMYPQHGTPSLSSVAGHVFRFTQTGHLGIGTNTSARSGLDVQGAITMENADTDLLTHSYSSYASRVNSGRLDITTGYSGTLASGRVFRFKYNATSWKAYHGRITLSGTGGFSSYEFGGYWNNSGSGQVKEIQNGINTSCAISTSGQAILVSITLGNTVVHPCFSLEYNQSGGDGPPRMDRAEVFIQ